MRVVELIDACEFLDHKRKPITEDLRRAGPYPYYGANGQQGWIDDYIFDEPLVLLAEDGGNFGSMTKPIAYKITGKTWVNNHAHVLRPLPECDVDYLTHVLSFYDVSKIISGTTRAKLTKENAETIRIPLPSLLEQQSIAKRLEQSDRLRRIRRFAIELTDTILFSIFREMFAEYFGNGLFDRFGDLVKITGGGTPSRDNSEFFQGKIPWLTSKDMRGDYIWDTEEHITEAAVKSSATKLVPAGSILVVVKSKVLMHRLPVAIAKVSLCHGQDIKSIQCSKALHHQFARFVLKYHETRLLNLARGANTEGLTLPMLKQLPVPKVDYSEQKHFALLAERHERLRAVQCEALRQAEHLFQTLLHQTFSDQH
jgi:type I restriction enzyme, S subunit